MQFSWGAVQYQDRSGRSAAVHGSDQDLLYDCGRGESLYRGVSSRRSLPDRKIEIGVRERLTRQREVPPLLLIGSKSAVRHRPGQQRAVRMRLAAHARIRRPGFRAEEVERRAHVELAPIRTPHQGQIDGRAARMAGALGNIPFLEEVALV